MSQQLNPGAQTTTCVFNIPGVGPRSLTALGDTNLMPSRIVREEIDDANTPDPKHRLKHKRGKLTMQAVTDQDLSWLDRVEGATLTTTLLNGRKLVFGNVTLVVDEGVNQNITQGTTETLTFTYGSAVDQIG